MLNKRIDMEYLREIEKDDNDDNSSKMRLYHRQFLKYSSFNVNSACGLYCL